MPSNASHEARINALEKRLNAVAPKLKGDEVSNTSSLASINADITSLFADFSSLSGLVGNSGFLANLSLLPHQSDNNTTLAGVLTWSNNLTDNLIANGFMHS